MARSVAECSAVLALAGCTIAVTDRFAAFELDSDIEAGYARALEAVQALGARLVEMRAPVKAFTLDSPEFALVLVEMWAYHQQFADREQLYRPQLRTTLRAAREAMSASEYARLQLGRAAYASTWESWFDRTVSI